MTDPTGKWVQNANGDWVCNNHNDTLWSLSQKVYGDGSQWQLLNFGKDPCKLQINDTLSSEKFGKANTFINATTSAEQFRFNASKTIKFIPGINILNDAFGTLTGMDLTGILLTPTERTRSAFSTMITAGTLGAGAYLSSLEKTAAVSLAETTASSTYYRTMSQSSETTALAVYKEWPECGGFLGDFQTTEEAQLSQTFSRIGTSDGRYVSPIGTSLSERGLPSNYLNTIESQWSVIKPFNWEAGIAAPWKDATGLGIQYKLPYSIDYLETNNFIEPFINF